MTDEIGDATPTWAQISRLADEVSREQAWLWGEIQRRDAILYWLEANAPDALRLCPYKIVREGTGARVG